MASFPILPIGPARSECGSVLGCELDLLGCGKKKSAERPHVARRGRGLGQALGQLGKRLLGVDGQ